ncbi:coat protein, partial [Acinetobacter variabilis]
MASVRLTDIYNRDLLASYIDRDSLEKTAFADSGVLATNNEFSELLNARTAIQEVPYWNDLDASIEPNYSNDNPADKA